MHTIRIQNLTIPAVIGVFAWERKIRQPLRFELALDADLSQAMVSDAVDDTLDYGAVAAVIAETCEQYQPQLLEALAGRILEELFAQFPATRIAITIHKKVRVDGAGDFEAAVSVTRERDDA